MIDSQSVEADAVVGSDSRGFDGGKPIDRRKRHVVVELGVSRWGDEHRRGHRRPRRRPGPA
ncbi:hypothetical protein PV726_46330 [Streptomyces europaeiscabiei]|uniref:hypothetical protein n=1 Tax=Streptomyces europaeiscabiei TaxID=146819 RepID=UPI0029A65C16|nr:hypothetical protein [Streptomyces europaeiscabiei]MDX3697490.1 hypothetical protein [Streptomyces europaeiscabiei]